MIKYETNSKLVKEGQTFIALIGNSVDGHDYIKEAIDNGASHIICQRKIDFDVDYTIVEDTNKFLEDTLKNEYADKINELTIIGVTGTNGKTTTCYLTYQLLQKLGVNVVYIGTIGFHHKTKNIELDNTTPVILTTYNLLLEAINLNATHVVMEVSSHALAFNRLHGINLSCGAFTNLTQDHLDFHGDMNTYLNEKLKIIKLLKPNSPFISNIDDENGINFINNYPNSKSLGTNADYNIIDYKITPASIDLNFNYNGETYNSFINLTSKFNVYNYLTAVAMLTELNFDLNTILEKAKEIKPPKGRCETINVNNGYAVIDYAHTPDAVEKVINAYTELKENKIITIIGCGGDRDNKKRPIMGSLASNLSDYVIFTNDNPRTEDEKNIMKDILAGVTKENYEVIHDRKEAIKKGIDLLQPKDILLILGKGHEDYQIIGKTKHHLDDAEEVINWKNN